MPPNQNSTNDDPSGAPKKNSNTDEQDNESNHSEEVVDPDNTTEKVSKKNDRAQGSKKTTKRPGKCPRCGNRVIKTVNQAESTYSCKASGIDGVKNVNKVTTCGHCGKFTTSPDSVEDSSAHQTEKKSCTHCGKTIPKEGAVPVSSKTKVCPGCGRPVTAIDQGDKDAAGAAIIGGAVAGAEVLEERPDGSDEVTPGTENVEEDTDLQKEDAVLNKEDEDLKKDEEEDLQKEDENLQKESEDLREGTEDLQDGTEDLQTEDTTIEDIEADERDKSSEKVAPTRESFSDKQVKFDVDVRVVEESDDISDSKDESEDIKTESELEKEIEPVLEVLTEPSDVGDGIQEGRGEPHSPSELSVEQWPNVENMEAPE